MPKTWGSHLTAVARRCRHAAALVLVVGVLVGIMPLELASAGSGQGGIEGPAPVPAPLPVAVGAQNSASWTLRVLYQATPTATLTQQQQLQAFEQQLDAAWDAQNWALAISIIDQMMLIDPNYDNIRERKYYAHVNYGYQLMTEGDCSGAYDQFLAALALQPAGEEAVVGLELLAQYCATPVPPTATATVSAEVTVTITPTSAGGATVTPQPGTVTETRPISYVVQAGDTLYGLSKTYGVTIQEIMQANGMLSYFLRIGDTIYIPGSAEAPPGPLVHIVQPGETLPAIADRYGTTAWAIMSVNGLSSYTVYAFQALYIPTPLQPGPIIHIVQKNETLYTIAQRYGTTVPLIMMANSLVTYDLYIFQQVIIPPVGWTGWPPIILWISPGPAVPSGTTYVVQPGDTLWGISVRYGTTVAALKAANGLTSSTIYPGMTLQIP